MKKVLYTAEYIDGSSGWRVRLLDLDISVEDDEKTIALSKALTIASSELGIPDNKIRLLESNAK